MNKVKEWWNNLVSKPDSAEKESEQIAREDMAKADAEPEISGARLNLRNPAQKEVPTVADALAKGVEDYIQPIENCSSLIIKCPNCKKIHFRHAGYIETAMPFVNESGDSKVINNSHAVKVCLECKKSYVSIGDKMYDISDEIDLEAWEKSEVELQKATGPGGEC